MVAKSYRLRVESLESRRLFAVNVLADDLDTQVPIDSPTEQTVVIDSSAKTNVRAAEIRLTYDTSLVDLDATNIRAGSAWHGRGSVVANVDDAAGTIHLFVYSARPLRSDAGSLVEFDFDGSDALARDVASTIQFQKFRLNEGAIEATPTIETSVPCPEVNSQHRLRTSLWLGE